MLRRSEGGNEVTTEEIIKLEGRALDAAIAEHVLGLKPNLNVFFDSLGGWHGAEFHKSLDACREAEEALLRGEWLVNDAEPVRKRLAEGEYAAELRRMRKQGGDKRESYDIWMAMAPPDVRCRAMLLAIQRARGQS